MPYPFSLRALRSGALVAGLGVVALSCTQPDDTGGKATSTAPCSPVAVAGVNLTGATSTKVNLDGSASTVCQQDSIVYVWSFESVPVGSGVDGGDLDVTDPVHPSFTPDVVGTYVLSLVVSDATGVNSAPDLVVITISAGSAAPVADCGGTYSGQVGDRISLDGSGSSDPEGAELTYAWTLSARPDCSALGTSSVFNADTAGASFVPDCGGVYTVALAVSDGESWSDAVFCAVNIGDLNARPIADAGTSGSLSPCTEHRYELDGYGSYDPEGTPLVYEWTLLSVPAGSAATQADISDPTIPNPYFTWDVTGEYSFELRVNDGVQDSAPDIVVITFQDVDSNAVPIANAGEDQTITKETECETASYVFTCAECPSEDARLDGTSSDDPVNGDDLSFLWSDPTRELSITSASSPMTTVLTPSFPSEYNVATTKTWDITLSVSDCADTDTDTVRVTYTCTGTY